MRSLGGALCAIAIAVSALALTERSVSAWACDFLTGGGFIYVNGSKGTFGVGGGCKHGSGTDGVPYWGHLEYQDHGIGLNVHWTSITSYEELETALDDKGRPIGRRRICGTARTNLYGDVDFAVIAGDAGEPGTSDQFDIQLRSSDGTVPYTTWGFDTSGGYPHMLGGGTNGGGNIQLHKDNPSTTGIFDGSCPAAGTPGEVGTPSVRAPEPAFINSESEWPW